MMFLENQRVQTTLNGSTWHGHVLLDDGGTYVTCYLESPYARLWGARGDYEILRSQLMINPRYAATPCPHCGKCPEED